MNRDSSSGRSAQRLRERFREETVRAMLGAAEQVFAERGLHDASMGEIAERAGVAVGTLYNHFKDREALLKELMALRGRELLERLDASLELLAKQPFTDQLAGFLRALFAHVEEHRPFLLIVMQNEAGKSKPSGTMTEILSRIDRLLKVGYQKKLLRPEGEPFHPTFLMAAARSMIMREKFGAPPVEPERAVSLVLDFFLHGACK
jgi:AcrR family transcriptional regulator